MLSSKERVLLAMERKQADRVPVYPVFTEYHGARIAGIKYSEVALNPKLRSELILRIGMQYGFDGVTLYCDPPKDWNKNLLVIEKDNDRYFQDKLTGKIISRIPLDDMPVLLDTTPIIQKESDLDKLRIPKSSEYWDTGQMDSIKAAVKKYGDTLFIAGHCAAQSMNYLAAVRGSDQAMLDLYDNPLFAKQIMDIGTEISIELGKAYIEAGVHGIYIGDAWASCSIISPEQYLEFCLPLHKRVTEIFHGFGVKVYLHICGNSAPILELMAATGVDAIEPLDPLGGVKIADAKNRVGDKVCLMGGVNTLTLLNGTPEQVLEEAQQCIEQGAAGGGYMLGSGDDIPQAAPQENVEAMVQAAQTFGVYR
jgi:uroporphyrinogen decarboxylase